MRVTGLKESNKRGQTTLSPPETLSTIRNSPTRTGRSVPFRLFCFLLACTVAQAQTPDDVIAFLRSTALALASAHGGDPRGKNDAGPFLECFDSDMPHYAELRDEIETLVERAEIGSAIEIVTDEGDDSKRKLDLDWVLEIQDQRPRRAILKCTIEKDKKRKRAWKITSLEPIEFFKY